MSGEERARVGGSRARAAALAAVALLALVSCGKGDGGGSAATRPEARAGGAPTARTAPVGEYRFDFPPELPFDAAKWTTNTKYKPPGDPRAQRVPGRAFTLWWEAFPATLRTEGPNSNTTEMASVHGLLYETLVQLDPETDEFIPYLASHWKVESMPDGTQTFTFRLDERARWADGRPVQADDVYWTWWHRVQADRNDPMSLMTFGENYEEPKVLDRLTIQVKTKQPNWRLFLYFGAGMQVYPAREVAIPGAKYLEDYNWRFPTGSGPYALASGGLRKGESLTLARRKDWWAEKEPYARNTYNFDQVRWVVIQDLEMAYEKFKKGELDWFQVGQARRWVEDVPKERIVQKGWVQRRKIYNKRPVGYSGLAFNMRKPPFDDRRVRLAFAHLFDRERLMEKIFFNEYEYVNSLYPGSDWGSGDERPRVAFDPAKAEDLLAEAGYTKRDGEGYLLGPDGQRLAVTLEYGSQSLERIWLVVQEDYKKAGIEFNLKLIDPTTLMKKVSERQFRIHYQAWGALIFPNPETSWRSSLADQPNNNNIVGFKDARVDELCKAYNLTMDRAEQKKIIREIDTIVCDAVPYAFGWYARSDRLLYWDRFGHPDAYLTRTGQHPEDSMVALWWFDAERDRRLQEATRKDESLPQGPLEVKPWG